MFSSHEHFRVLDLVHVAAQPPGDKRHANRESGTNTDDDAIANTLAQRRGDLECVRHLSYPRKAFRVRRGIGMSRTDIEHAYVGR